jgi:hypothetical protein
MNLASRTNDPLERFILFLVATQAANYLDDDGNIYWNKPFNPILGETFQGFFNDGSRCY